MMILLLLLSALICGVLGADEALTFSVEEAASLNELKKSSAGFVDYLENQQGVNQNLAKSARKRSRVIAAQQQMKQVFINWEPSVGSVNHSSSGKDVIFSTALSTTYGCVTANNFAGTARAAGFTGDIVVAVLPGMKPRFSDCLKEHKVIVYVADMKCEGTDEAQKCHLSSLPHLIAPVNLFRYYFYTYWSSFYQPENVIMLASFRDTFFQSNPFSYRTQEWYPPLSDLVLFEEFFPLKTVSRDIYLQTYLADCYGRDVLPLMMSNTVINTGMALGSRDGIVTYVSCALLLFSFDFNIVCAGNFGSPAVH
jgi:hypothetical protein